MADSVPRWIKRLPAPKHLLPDGSWLEIGWGEDLSPLIAELNKFALRRERGARYLTGMGVD